MHIIILFLSKISARIQKEKRGENIICARSTHQASSSSERAASTPDHDDLSINSLTPLPDPVRGEEGKRGGREAGGGEGGRGEGGGTDEWHIDRDRLTRQCRWVDTEG